MLTIILNKLEFNNSNKKDLFLFLKIMLSFVLGREIGRNSFHSKCEILFKDIEICKCSRDQ